MRHHRWTRTLLAALLALSLSACVDDGDTTADEENEDIERQDVPAEGEEGTNENAVED